MWIITTAETMDKKLTFTLGFTPRWENGVRSVRETTVDITNIVVDPSVFLSTLVETLHVLNTTLRTRDANRSVERTHECVKEAVTSMQLSTGVAVDFTMHFDHDECYAVAMEMSLVGKAYVWDGINRYTYSQE